MNQKQWPAETKARAEKAMSDLEAFWSNFRNSTQAGRRDLLPLLTRIRLAVASASQSDASSNVLRSFKTPASNSPASSNAATSMRVPKSSSQWVIFP